MGMSFWSFFFQLQQIHDGFLKLFCIKFARGSPEASPSSVPQASSTRKLIDLYYLHLQTRNKHAAFDVQFVVNYIDIDSSSKWRQLVRDPLGQETETKTATLRNARSRGYTGDGMIRQGKVGWHASVMGKRVRDCQRGRGSCETGHNLLNGKYRCRIVW